MRKQPTRAERALWNVLCHDQLGVAFRRQHPIGPFIVDFFAPIHKLIVEVDGESHTPPEQQAYDSARTAFFESQGMRVRRYTNGEVLGNGAFVLEDIRKALEKG